MILDQSQIAPKIILCAPPPHPHAPPTRSASRFPLAATAFATGTHNNPSVSSVRAMIPEEHASVATTLKELKSHKTPPTTNIPSGHSAAPAVQAIVVNCVSIVDPQLASIIGNELEVVTAALEDSQTASPTHCKVIATSEPRPFATCVAIVNHLRWK